MSYFDLSEVSQRPGCPIFSLLERVNHLCIDFLIYVRGNYVETRIRLRQSLCFDNWHAAFPPSYEFKL